MLSTEIREEREALARFVREHVEMPIHEFRQRHPYPFLLMETGQAATADETGQHTAVLGFDRPVAVFAPESPPAIPEGDRRMLLLPVVRSPRSPQTQRITVGRSSMNDLVLRFDQVSKLHAYFVPREQGPGLAIVDAGSTNGTMVNGVRLAPDEHIDVFDGDEIEFGPGLPFAFLATDTLHWYLGTLARRLGLR